MLELQFTPFAAITTNTTGAAINLDGQRAAIRHGRDEATVQIDITGTATVAVQARIEATLGWATVDSGITASKIVRIGRVVEVRLVTTGVSAGTVTGGVLA